MADDGPLKLVLHFGRAESNLGPVHRPKTQPIKESWVHSLWLYRVGLGHIVRHLGRHKPRPGHLAIRPKSEAWAKPTGNKVRGH